MRRAYSRQIYSVALPEFKPIPLLVGCEETPTGRLGHFFKPEKHGIKLDPAANEGMEEFASAAERFATSSILKNQLPVIIRNELCLASAKNSFIPADCQWRHAHLHLMVQNFCNCGCRDGRLISTRVIHRIRVFLLCSENPPGVYKKEQLTVCIVCPFLYPIFIRSFARMSE